MNLYEESLLLHEEHKGKLRVEAKVPCADRHDLSVAYTPELIHHGLRYMIGKGRRSEEVKEAIRQYDAIYFVTIGGAGALLSKAITKAEVIAWEDLGTEAVRRITVSDFPAIVVIDSQGNNLYD